MLTLPNVLTLSRIVAVPVLVALLWPHASPLAYAVTFVLYCLIGATDWVDGAIARSRGAVSRLGIFLDPIADKIMVVAVITVLIFTRDIHGLHMLPALVILLREIIVSGLREFLAGLSVSVPVSQLAKWKTAVQMTALGGLILAGALPGWPWLHAAALALLWVAAALTLVTGYSYLRVGLRHMD